MSTTRRKFACGAAAFAAAGGLSAAEGAAAVEGTLFNVWKFATKDGPGIRTVFALKWCPLRCVWCHSPESWSYAIEKYSNGETVGWKTTAEKVVEEALRDKPFYDASGGGLTLTGGEPLAQAAFCTEILRLAKAAGLHTAVETSGYAPAEVVEGLERFVDLWLYDVKLLDPEKCLRHTGRPLAPVLENLRHLNAAKRRIVMRCPMIPGINDDDAELKMRRQELELKAAAQATKDEQLKLAREKFEAAEKRLERVAEIADAARGGKVDPAKVADEIDRILGRKK